MESATALLIDPPLTVGRDAPAAEEAKPATARRRLRLGWLLTAIVLIAAVGGLSYLRTWPPMATVMSASMSPTIKTGDVVLLKHLDRAPRVGDIIAVSLPDQARRRYGYPPVVVHRVGRLSTSGDITTKGDAPPHPDPFTVRRGSVNARVAGHIPAAGHVVAFFTSTLGLIWMASGVLLLVVLPLVERQRDARERDETTLDELRTELRTISDEISLMRTQPVAEYLYEFESELTRALDDVARDNALS